MKWINISDRLPEYSTFVLVAYTSSSMHITRAWFDDLEKVFYHTATKNTFKTVTHWMNLPNPPEK